jgi:hypothetical protein
MKSTCRKRFASTLGSAFLLGAWCLVSGCVSAYVNPDYKRLEPRTIAVLPVENHTIQHLDKVSIGGLLQSLTFGGETFNIPELLSGAIRAALVDRGYAVVPLPAELDVDFRKPQDSPGGGKDYDAALYATILGWNSDPNTSPMFHLRYRIQIYRVPTAEQLFEGTFDCGTMDDPHRLDMTPLPSQIERCSEMALHDLPRAGE